MKVRLVIENGVVVDSGLFREHVSTLRDGSYNLSFELARKSRTSPQNRYLWGVVYPTVMKAMLNVGNIMTLESVHEFCLEHCGVEAVNYHTGEYIDLRGVRTSSMSDVQLITYIDLISDMCLEFLDTEIPKATKL